MTEDQTNRRRPTKPVVSNEAEGTITISMNWSKWIAIIAVLGSGGGLGWLGLSTASQQADMLDRWTGTEHASYVKDQLLVDSKQDAVTREVLQLAEATSAEVEKREQAVYAIPLIQQDIEHIKENFEEQKRVDINQSKEIEKQGEQLNKIRTGVELILQKIEE